MNLVHSINAFQAKIKNYLIEGDYDSALYSIHKLVNQVFCEPINTAKIFGSKLLDDLCQEIGALNLHKLRTNDYIQLNSENSNITDENPIVYIASKLQSSGGHTAVLADIIRLGPSSRSIILVTGIGGVTDHASIQHRFSSTQNVSFEYAPRGKHIDKLDWLQSRLLALTPSNVWLFNHHQDSVAISAVQPDSGYDLHFYHHGDHHLCLGVHLSYADHIDIHPMGYHHCKDDLKITNTRYLPMAVNDMGSRSESTDFKCGTDLVTCTAAGFNKVEVPYFIQYVEVIPKLLKEAGCTHIHIGRLTFFALWKIRSAMRKLGVNESKFVYIPFVSSVWKTLQQYKVDLYITSFPYGGARTLIEAMGAGVPLAIHSHCTSRLLGTFDMAYEGVMIWRNPNELYEFVKNLNKPSLLNLSKLARTRYLDFHSEDILKSALTKNAMPLKAPDLYQGYKSDILQQVIDISNQVSCTGAIRRVLYRNYRLWKSS